MNIQVLESSVQVELLRPSTRMLAEQPQQIPDWLQRASEEDRQYYFNTEQALAKHEQALDDLLREAKSLKMFAQFYAREMVRIPSGVVVDPEQIFVNTRHTFYVAKQKVVQCNRLTLPEFLLNGLYDSAAAPLEITLEGETLPPEITEQDLLEDIGGASMRSLYAKKFEETYTNEEVLQALQAVLDSRTDLSSLSAHLQGHISEHSLKIVNLGRLHAQGYSLGDLSLDGWKVPFQGLIVYCGPEGEAGPCVLYAPQAPGGTSWYEFVSIKQLNFHIAEWVGLPEGRSYLSRQSHASERDRTDAYMRLVPELPSQWRGIKRNPWPTVGAGALRQGVLLNVGWLQGEMQAVTPAGYRSATDHHRTYFARLNTELKALTRLASHEAGLISYEQFAFNLVKKMADELMADNGESVSVNPDLIMVELADSQAMTLTQLIIKEHHITEDSGPAHNPGIYPGIRLLPGHPPMSDLLNKYIANWSKALRPGEKYIDMLSSDYLDKDSPGYELRRDVYVNVQLHEMRRAALAELFAGVLERQQYERIERLIDRLLVPEPNSSIGADYPDYPQREGVYKFYLQGRKIQGVYVFRTMDKGVVQDFLYTPHAPDGRWFRPLAEFSASVRAGRLGVYYCKRAKFSDQRVIKTFVDGIVNSSADVKPPLLQANSRVFNFSHCYTDMIRQIIEGVDAQTSSLIEIVANLSYDAAVAAVAVIGCIFPPIGLGLSAAVMAKGVFEGGVAYYEGDNEKVFSSFLDCMLELGTLHIGKLGFSQAQKLIAKQLREVNTCMSVVSACSGKKVDLAVMTELMKEALAEPDSSERTLLE
ncbi:NEL domain-containing protein [Pseudomonas sp. IT-P253]|uniref:dermonecrotic toxin domain-containing protein n=1 Tax=Pseudomonas sp. IT-P253 TaxID=3026455 RepID=UPI0039E19901